MPKDPLNFYKTQLGKLDTELESVKSRLRVSSLLRMLTFLSIAALLYGVWSIGYWLLWGMCLAVPVFIFLVLRHGKLSYQKKLRTAKRNWNVNEIRVLDRDFGHMPMGKEFENAAHPYSKDIDLFGRGSFFQYINRTVLLHGRATLSQLMCANTIEGIPERQEAIKELAQNPGWMQEFEAVASLVKTELPAEQVVAWLLGYRTFLPDKIKLGTYIFTAISLLAWLGYGIGLLSGYVVFGIFLLGLGITGKYLKKIGKLSAHTSKIQSTFRQYASLLALLEQKEFSSALLQEQRLAIINENQRSSSAVRRFSKLLDALDQRNNIVVALFTNGFFLRDLYVSRSIEHWISNHKEDVAAWFETIAFFDAYISLGNYTFNHPGHTFPVLGTSDSTTIRAKQCAHPLLDPAVAVANDFEISKDGFFVITGANMAGKSTFLRTIGLQIVMANTGLPVCAEAMWFTPIRLVTSMRTSDSLTDEESYFFSELKRLKYIIDTIKESRHFIILDEILKGTNSTDKATGSRKFLEKLVRLEASGIIATHDLSLCAVAKTIDQVKNHFFDAQIKEDELYFDYKIKEGICQNMNASFLLRKMDIV